MSTHDLHPPQGMVLPEDANDSSEGRRAYQSEQAIRKSIEDAVQAHARGRHIDFAQHRRQTLEAFETQWPSELALERERRRAHTR